MVVLRVLKIFDIMFRLSDTINTRFSGDFCEEFCRIFIDLAEIEDLREAFFKKFHWFMISFEATRPKPGRSSPPAPAEFTSHVALHC